MRCQQHTPGLLAGDVVPLHPGSSFRYWHAMLPATTFGGTSWLIYMGPRSSVTYGSSIASCEVTQ
eukprot:m.1227320 g.1227320  ORF g.1227320 m.1227320 type:complete len:65 (+) comp24642_c0_seq24:2056-2250(+)